MTHLILALSKGKDDPRHRAFDLVLTALIVMTGAEASWLEYTDGDHHHLIVRGESECVRAYLSSGRGPGVTTSLDGDPAKGRLGVIVPENHEQAANLLDLMARECSIILAIDRLFQILARRVCDVLQSMGSAVILVSLFGEASYVNSAAERILCKILEDIIGRPASFIDGPWVPCLMARPSQPAKGVMEYLIVEDKTMIVDWKVNPLSLNGTPQGWVIIIHDRTSDQHCEEAVSRAERLTTTATLVGALAHELRNPLSSARGLLQLIDSNSHPHKVAGYRDLVIREIDQSVRLLDEFLMLGKPANIDT